jgi:hypothetical protein
MKQRLRWRLTNLMGDTPAYITKLQMILAGITASLASSDYALFTDKHTAIILILGGVIDKILLGGLKYED